ncbi:hypothetical protein A3E04_03230 [Candidatus Kuenenbacteria bacterium RIFCSPHIGHO2_12_FULL_42_14]|uniref:Uncharacterized protein n=1 Tax=Candidatus Kuenenbacteria bacterium RIFCSPHIGHO2_12_FULL_42_14 TaxID=1798563 RepID=A0A1F6GKA6_9BACT|nr:MAG: hypothetical protein A3E04_03230 [Candidatus Kuenenbacteria bacterium RIFCSPHIGHO2_12_FULL_42_14]
MSDRRIKNKEVKKQTLTILFLKNKLVAKKEKNIFCFYYIRLWGKKQGKQEIKKSRKQKSKKAKKQEIKKARNQKNKKTLEH